MEKVDELIKKDLEDLSFMNLKLFALDSQEEMIRLKQKLESYEKLVYSQQKRIESAILLCDCIKENISMVDSIKKQNFRDLKSEDFINSMMLTIQSYVDLWLFSNTNRR